MLTSFVVPASLVVLSVLLGTKGWVTPWLAAGGAFAAGSWFGTPSHLLLYTCITCYFLVDFTRAPDDVVGDSLDAGQAFANDSALKNSIELVKRCLKRAWLKPLFLAIGFVVPLPDFGLQLRGIPGLLVLTLFVRIGLTTREISPASRNKQFVCFAVQSLTLVCAWAIHELVSGPNPLLVLTMIAGMAVPSVFWPAAKPNEELSEAEIAIPWVVCTGVLCLLTPGLTASAGGMMFLKRSIWRPTNLMLIGAYIEGWNLQELCFGGSNAKTALAEFMNQHFTGALEDNFHLTLAVLACICFTGIWLLSDPRFCRTTPNTNNSHKLLAIAIGQSLFAGGVTWTFVFCVVGFINTWVFRTLSPESDDARAFAFLTPLLI